MSDQLPDVMFVEDLAKALRTSVRTIQRRLRAGGDLPPQSRSVSTRRQWLRRDVEAWQQSGTAAAGNGLRYFPKARVARGGR